MKKKKKKEENNVLTKKRVGLLPKYLIPSLFSYKLPNRKKITLTLCFVVATNVILLVIHKVTTATTKWTEEHLIEAWTH